jgi:hypothetical protein
MAMTRKFSLALAMAAVLFSARGAAAAVITPTDLDTWLTPAHVSIAGPTLPDSFDPAPPETNSVGSLINEVFFNATTLEYTYVETVTPNQNNAMFFNTGFNVRGFTGTAGWSFSDSDGVDGCGGPGGGCLGDFVIQGEVGSGSQLNWFAFDDLFNDWDAGETIRLFFVSTLAPREGANYNLTARSTGTAQSFAPVPEPGSIALLGSGLAVLYGTARRRRNAKR